MRLIPLYDSENQDVFYEEIIESEYISITSIEVYGYELDTDTEEDAEDIENSF